MDIGDFFIFFFEKMQAILNFLLLEVRVVLFGHSVSVFGIFIIACVITLILSVFLRSAKW